MAIKTVAIISPGEMGSAVGRAFHEHGFDVITCLEGRSEASRQRAEATGFRDGGSLSNIVGAADIILSILPPARGLPLAKMVAEAMRETGKTPAYVDCNAVAPETAVEIGAVIEAAGARFIDCGIVGSPPGKTDKPPRFFASGSGAKTMDAFNGKGIDVRQCGAEAGKASSVKMCYAGITKGTSALHAAMLMAAEKLGVADQIHEELPFSVPPLYKRMENVTNGLPAVADRYIGEMREIEKTMAMVGLPTGFHDAAALLFTSMTKTPFADERRDTIDRSRTLRQTIEVCARSVPVRDAAE
jgi:3-hydroxyisobutyrate dehydrogenase-like beta-hydroxyacid dehydrogenase